MKVPLHDGSADRRWRLDVARAVAGVMLIASGVWFGRAERPAISPGDPMAKLVRISHSDSFRSSEARLSAPFPYHPYHPADRRRGSEPDDFDRTRTFLDIQRPAQLESVEGLHAWGVAVLLSGARIEAATILERAATLAESRGDDAPVIAMIWNDLAVARYEAGKSGDARQLVAALDAAERASATVANVPAIVWTRAIVLDGLNLRDSAAVAWERYLELDPASPWRTEAQNRLRERSWKVQELDSVKRQSLLAACSRGDIHTPYQTILAHPKECRTIGEEELLPRWAAEYLAGNKAEAKTLQTVRTLGKAISNATGESLLEHCVAAIDRTFVTPVARRATAEAILQYRKGREAYLGAQAAIAERELAVAEEKLAALNHPLVILANLHRASCLHLLNRSADVAPVITRIDRFFPRHDTYYAARGLRGWIRGLALARLGEPSSSIKRYEEALEAFGRAREVESEATVRTLRADTLDAMMATREAWQDRMAAVEILWRRRIGSQPAVWMRIAAAAIRDDLERAADVILQELGPEVKRRSETHWIAEVAMWRAVIRSRVADPFSDSDFGAMRRAAAWARADPGPALPPTDAAPTPVAFRASTAVSADLEEALAYYRSGHDRHADADILNQDRGGNATSDDSAADASLVNALSEIERQAASVDDPVERAFLSDRVRTMLLISSELRLAHGRSLAALWFSDRARQVVMRTFGGRDKDAAAIRPDTQNLGSKLLENLPHGVTVVHQDLQSDALLTWVIRDGHVEFVRTPISAAVLTVEIDAFVSGLRQRNQDAMVPAAQELYRKVLGPVRDLIAGSGPLVYSPAPALRALPVSVLHDGHQLLVESRSVAVTRSVGRLSAIPFAGRAATGDVLVTLAASGFPSHALEGAMEEVASVAAIHGTRSTSLRGAMATPKEFLRVASGFDVIHVASHARVNGLPLQNAIEFGSERVRAYDLTRLRLTKHPIVILAGCRTDDETSGRATLSLANAFIAAGASAVVGTLWEVEDRSTARLMTELHRHLARGLAPADALRNAQQAAIRRGDPMSTWAAFQVQM